MEAIFEGKGRLLMDPDPDKAREFFKHKSRSLANKLVPLKDAITKYVKDGSYLAPGGFGGVRAPLAAIHEIIRQKRKNLKLLAHPLTYDFQLLSAAECFDYCDIAYIIGFEIRGVSKVARKYMESGRVECVEWSNAALSWRLKAAALGIPFIVGRQTLGADSLPYSSSKVISCPYTKKKFATFPALYPDVAIIHVHEADIFGNCSIKGITISDEDLARAAKNLIITCERIVPTEKFRDNPNLANIPYFCVDAVCEVPFGAYPGNMAYEYYSDEDHIMSWLKAEEKEGGVAEMVKKYIMDVKDFDEYLNICGGLKRMQELRQEEFLIHMKNNNR